MDFNSVNGEKYLSCSYYVTNSHNITGESPISQKVGPCSILLLLGPLFRFIAKDFCISSDGYAIFTPYNS